MGAMGPRTGYGARTSQGAGPIEAPFSPTRVGSGSLCACVAVTGRGPVGRTATEDKRRWVVAVRWSVVAGPAGLSSPADPHGGFHSAGPHRGFHPAAHIEAFTPRPARGLPPRGHPLGGFHPAGPHRGFHPVDPHGGQFSPAIGDESN